MKAIVYQTKEGFEAVNSNGELWQLYRFSGQWCARKFGTWSPQWNPSGRKLTKIPNPVKSLFFKLQKQTT